MHDLRSGTPRRPTEEEVALNDRTHQRGQIATRLDQKKSETEKRFAALWQRKKELSSEKRDHVAAISAVEMLSSKRLELTEELTTVSDALVELGHQLAACNFSAGKNVAELYNRSMTLSSSLERNFNALGNAQSTISSLAPSAAQYDQVVVLIAQMDEFFAKLNAALNGVIDEHILPPAEAEEQELDK